MPIATLVEIRAVDLRLIVPLIPILSLLAIGIVIIGWLVPRPGGTNIGECVTEGLFLGYGAR